jgi:ornithine cyclodeaminase/alanine dehydrogenase-like protein (mu-crystallin family)
MLYISAKHMEEIIDLNEMMACIEKAFILYEEGRFHMPERMHVDRPEGTVLYMPCFSEAVSGTKIVSTFPGNSQKGIATIQGTMLLNKSSTGEPLAILDGAMLTAYRTGAVGGVGMRYTTRATCERVGLIGMGVQGFFQVLYACAVRPIKTVFIYDYYSERAEAFKKRLESKLPHQVIVITSDVEELVRGSEIIITATPSTSPVLPDDPTLLKGKHIIAIGSYKYEMRELPKALFGVLDALYMDSELASQESGDLIVPVEEGWFEKERMMSFGKVFEELMEEPLLEEKTTLFKSVGMALFDLLVAEAIYTAAVQKNIGLYLGENHE